MSSRDLGFVALGRFLVVERYCEAHQPPSTHPARSPRPDRTGGAAGKPASGSGARSPARPQR
jgi:hypothetical protein